MKLTEIKKIRSANNLAFEIPKNAITSAKNIGKSDYRDVFSSSFGVEEGQEYFAFFNKDQNGEVIASVIVHEVRIDDKDVAEIKRIWVRDDLRRKGYISALIKFVKDFSKMSIMSDAEQTSDAIEFWKGMSNSFNVKMINLENGEISNRDDSVYAEDKYRLFIESYEFKIGVGKITNNRKNVNEWVDPILPPYQYFTDGDL